MSNWGILDGGNATQLPVSSSGASQGSANLSTATSWDTPTAWTEIIASTPYAVCGLHLTGSVTPIYGYLEFAIGAAGSEQRIGVPIHNRNERLIRRFLPIALPAGTRISFRVASVATGTAVAQVGLIPQSFRAPIGYSRWAIYGHDEWAANNGLPQGFSVDAGTTANTKGAWVEISAAVPFAIKHLTATFTNKLTASNSGINFLVDIGVGAAGSEVPVLRDLFMQHQGAIRQTIGEISTPISIPAGSRITMRAQSSNNNSAARLFGGWLAFGG